MVTQRPAAPDLGFASGGRRCAIAPGLRPPWALKLPAHATLGALQAGLAGLDLTASEINALANLADGRARSIGELAADTATKPTTLTSALDRLVRRGYVVRQLDPADRRSFLVSLTADGRQAAGAARAAVGDIERAVLATITSADLTGFHAVTHAIMKVLR